MITKEIGVSKPWAPVGRFGKSEEVASIVDMLVDNGYMTGQTLVLNGGIYMNQDFAFALAAIAALRTATVPAERFDVGEDYKLPVAGTPIMCSYQKVGGRFVFDASKREELGGDERIHITLGDEGHVHSLQKGLRGVFTADEFNQIMHAAQSRCSELRDIVHNLEESQ